MNISPSDYAFTGDVMQQALDIVWIMGFSEGLIIGLFFAFFVYIKFSN